MITNLFKGDEDDVWVKAGYRTYKASAYSERTGRQMHWTLQLFVREWKLWEQHDFAKTSFPSIEAACRQAAYRQGCDGHRGWLAPLDELPP